MKTIKWLSLLQTITIMMVVMYHVNLIDMSTRQKNLFCTMMSDPAGPVRIPLFIFISGGLLYATRIEKRWPTTALYKDKLVRLLLPLVFFAVVYFAIKAALAGIVKTPAEVSVGYFIENLVLYDNHPSAPLWYLATLATLMLLYPLLKRSCDSLMLMAAVSVAAVVIWFVDLSVVFPTNYFNLAYTNKYLIFFYLGILTFKFRLYDYLGNMLSMTLLLAAYTAAYLLGVELLDSIVGIFAAMSTALVVTRRTGLDLSFAGNRIYQIYLMSMPFQAFVELVLWKRMFYNDDLFYLFYVLNIVFGIAGPLIVTCFVERCPVRFIRLCFGLK